MRQSDVFFSFVLQAALTTDKVSTLSVVGACLVTGALIGTMVFEPAKEPLPAVDVGVATISMHTPVPAVDVGAATTAVPLNHPPDSVGGTFTTSSESLVSRPDGVGATLTKLDTMHVYDTSSTLAVSLGAAEAIASVNALRVADVYGSSYRKATQWDIAMDADGAIALVPSPL
jgi:hypothetical protein